MFWKQGNHALIKKGIKQLFPRLWRHCLMLSGSPDKASDLAQSTCLRALEKAHLYSNNTHLDRWLFRIAKNIWFNELRAESIRQGNSMDTHEELNQLTSNQNPESTMINKDIIRSVFSLPEAQRITVSLVYIEGYSYQQAAEILEIPTGTIMSRLAAARQKLSNKLLPFKEGHL